MKYFLVLVVAISAVHAASPHCDTNILKQCTTLESIMTFNQWPRDLADVNNMCKLLKEGTNCVEEFNSNCVQNAEGKKIAHRIWIALLSRYYDICYEDVDKQAFLQRVQCYTNQNVAKNITEFHQKYVRLVETAHTYATKKRFPFYCCSILYFQKMCWMINRDLCGKVLADYVQRAQKELFNEPFQEMCNSFSYYETCIDELDYAQYGDLYSIIHSNQTPPTLRELAMPTLYDILLDI